MRFVAVDIETANPRMSSICQIGLVHFEDGREVSAQAQLVDPGEYFDPYNVAVHGITADQVRGSQSFGDLHDWLCEQTVGQIVACHTQFDRVALAQACGKQALKALPCNWLDTCRVARRAWPEFSKSGYGLANLARHHGISFQHHDAVEDARTAGLILLRAIAEKGFDPAEWVQRCSRSASNPRAELRRQGDGDGPLLGEHIVFTGSLELPRRNAADLAHQAGAAVEPNVTRQLISGGQQIRIDGEADFMRVCQE